MKLYREGTLLRCSSGDLWMITEITKKVWGKPPAQLTYTEVRLRDSLSPILCAGLFITIFLLIRRNLFRRHNDHKKVLAPTALPCYIMNVSSGTDAHRRRTQND